MIKPTNNVGLISKIIGKPLTTLPEGTVFLLLEAEEIIGLAAVTPWDTHLAITDIHISAKYSRDKDTQLKLAKEFQDYLKLSPFGKIIGMIPNAKQDSIAFLQRAGFKREGVIKRSCIHEGTVMDQTIVGIENGVI